jgi:hypothetical protein
VRTLAVLLLLTACDLQPAKRDEATGTVTAKPTPANKAPTPAPPPVAATPCQKASVHITNIIIAGVTDPVMKKQQEQTRASTERRIAESCTREKWNDEKQRCFLDGKNNDDVAACFKKFPLPGQEFPPNK